MKAKYKHRLTCFGVIRTEKDEENTVLCTHEEEKIDENTSCEKSLEKSFFLVPDIEDFCVLKPISRGAYGKVFLGHKKTNPGKKFAIKVMKKSEMINKNMVDQVNRERNALALSRSPFCVQLFYSLQTNSCVYLVMEYLIGGDLKSLLSVYGFFEEKMATFYTAEIVLAIEYLHKHGIAHRDIKPDNMLLTAEGHVKLTDFGLSRVSLHRDLEIDDLVNGSPNLCNARTPGQLLSLTSHLSFGSHEKIKYSPENRNHNVSGIEAFKSSEFQITMNLANSKSETFYSCTNCSADNSLHCHCVKSTNVSNVGANDSFRSPFIKERRRRKWPYEKKENFENSSLLHRFSHLDFIEHLATTPKRFAKDSSSILESYRSPMRGVLKHRAVSGDHNTVMFSTPVSDGLKRTVSETFSISKKQTRFLVSPHTSTPQMGHIPVSPIETPFEPRRSYEGYRTPKSVRLGKRGSGSDVRVLGTPDYLAPELLLRKEHGSGVDWWALGVCLYEFMTGVLPFNDETPQAVFSNILMRVLEWPEGEEALSNEAKFAIDSLLTIDPAVRPNGYDLRKMGLFESIDWDNILTSQAPFIPQPDNDMDTSYFHARNELQNLNVSQFDT